MKALADAGYPQAVIPPHERPNVPLLRQLGFSGGDEQVVAGGAAGSGSAVGGKFGLGDVGGERGDGLSLRRFAGWPGAPDGGKSAG